ncbi:MAG: mechanosensitive ion channel family protein [Opitutaceae bacterium]
MKRLILFLTWMLASMLVTGDLRAAEAPIVPSQTAAGGDEARAKQDAIVRDLNNQAVGVEAARDRLRREPGLLEHLVDSVLAIFDVRSNESTTTHYVIAAVFLVAALLLRRVATGIVFRYLRKLAAKTQSTLDDKLFPALEPPAATFVMLVGIFAALSVLKLSVQLEQSIDYATTIAFSLVIFWGLFRAFGALLDHGHEIALRKNMGIAAFMPWIKRTLMIVFVIVGVLMVIQSLGQGEKVKTIVAGLGIGGLAFALAAQDTLANLFGSIVVAIDQPFKIGEAVKIGANEGVVEDIGLRSTRLRPPGKNLIIIPNKVVAAEPIINNSRFTRRRVEQVVGLTYDTTPAQMEAMVAEIQRLIVAEKEVDATSVMVFFRDFAASALEIWIAYETPDPDFKKHMAAKQRLNLAIMRAIAARGLDFAFPTQTVRLAPGAAEKLANPNAGEARTSSPQ